MADLGVLATTSYSHVALPTAMYIGAITARDVGQLHDVHYALAHGAFYYPKGVDSSGRLMAYKIT